MCDIFLCVITRRLDAYFNAQQIMLLGLRIEACKVVGSLEALPFQTLSLFFSSLIL